VGIQLTEREQKDKKPAKPKSPQTQKQDASYKEKGLVSI
jgi:hypothetical protein